MSTSPSPAPGPRKLSDEQLRQEFLARLANFWRRRKRLPAGQPGEPPAADSDQPR